MGHGPSASAVLRGKDASLSTGFVLLGVALVLLTVLSVSFTWVAATVLEYGGLAGTGRTVVLALGLVAVGSGGLNTWMNDGVLVSIVLGFLPAVGAVGVHLLISLVGRLPSPVVTADLPVLLTAIGLVGAGAILGIAGVNRYRGAGYENRSPP